MDNNIILMGKCLEQKSGTTDNFKIICQHRGG